MVLEALIICVDNSDWSLNGDFGPTRLDAQRETTSLLAGAKVQSNPENAVGLIAMAGTRVEVLLAPTTDMGSLLQSLHDLRSQGACDFVRAIQTAQLALKHRVNKNQRQRIALFVCSPIKSSEKQMEQLGKILKKNSISLDIVSFGEVAANHALLVKLFDGVNSNATSHLLEVESPTGPLSAKVMSSAIVTGEIQPAGSGAPGTPGGIPADNDFGVDPDADPELYLALRLSMEDERNRQRRQEAAAAQTGSGGAALEMRSGATQEETRAGSNLPYGDDRSNVSVGGAPAEGVQLTPGMGGALGMGGDDRLHGIPSVEDIEKLSGLDDELRQALILSLEQNYVSHEASSAPPAAGEASSSSSATAAAAAMQDDKPTTETQDPKTAADSGSDGAVSVSDEVKEAMRVLSVDAKDVDLSDVSAVQSLLARAKAAQKEESETATEKPADEK